MTSSAQLAPFGRSTQSRATRPASDMQRPRQDVPAVSSNSIPTAPLQIDDNRPVAILIMGPTGAGKSSFIRAVTGAGGPHSSAGVAPTVGHGLRSCTATMQPIPTTVDERECLLIDTPGYDDTTRSDAEILRDMAIYLEASLKVGCPMTGVLYLHRITDNRLGGAAVKNLRMLQALCGPQAMRNVVICSTMWDLLESRDEGEARERELRDSFWKPMIDQGAQVVQLDGSRPTALAAIRAIIPLAPAVLRLQDELANKKMKLSDTAAGREVGYELSRALEVHQEELERLQEELSGAQDRDRRSIEEEIAREQRAIRDGECDARILRLRREEVLEDLRRGAASLDRGGSRFVDALMRIAEWLQDFVDAWQQQPATERRHRVAAVQ